MRLSAFIGLFVLSVSSSFGAEPIARKLPAGTPKLPPGFEIARMADKKEAARAADWIEKEYGGQLTEPAQMLVGILRGMRADGSNGWFAPCESRFSWQWLAKAQGLGANAKSLPKKQFHGPAAIFDQLDRDGDGAIAPADLDWSRKSPYVQQASAITRIFRRMDGNTDGELTRAEIDAFFEKVSRGKESISAADLRRFLIPRGPAGFSPGDAPSVTMLLKAFFASELGSLSTGPRVGDTAPGFTLHSLDGKQQVDFLKAIGKKPVVLILGNFTCGPFRALYPNLEGVYRRHKGEANFLMVYVREAHPTDGWKMAQNERLGVSVKQPRSLGERRKVAGQFCTKLKPEMPFVVDEIDDRVGNLYSGMPGRMYVIDSRGKVAYKSGRGPFGFSAGELEQALLMTLLEQSTKEKK